MTHSVFVYLVDLPHSVREMVCPCDGGYCVYLNSRLSQSAQEKSFRHAIWHIEHDDFSKEDVQLIEKSAHEGVKT